MEEEMRRTAYGAEEGQERVWRWVQTGPLARKKERVVVSTHSATRNPHNPHPTGPGPPKNFEHSRLTRQTNGGNASVKKPNHQSANPTISLL